MERLLWKGTRQLLWNAFDGFRRENYVICDT